MTDLAELHDDLRAMARGLLGRRPAGALDRARLVEAGWLGLEVPAALDGAEATFAEVAVVLEEMGRAATASPYLGSAVLGVGALRSVAPGGGRDALLRDAASGGAQLAVALAPSGGAALAEPPFRIERTAGAARLRGRAEFVADAPEADHLLLLATDPDRGPALVHVPAALAEVTPQPVVDATRSFGVVAADGLSLTGTSIWPLRDERASAAQHLADRAAVAVACDSLGLGAAMLDATVAYVGQRRQFDRPVGSFQAVKHACADMLVQLTVGRELVSAAVAAVAGGAPDAGPAAARAKSFVSAAAVDVVGTALQLHGGIGYTWESGIHVYLKRAVLNRSLFGSPVDQRRRLAGRLSAATV